MFGGPASIDYKALREANAGKEVVLKDGIIKCGDSLFYNLSEIWKIRLDGNKLYLLNKEHKISSKNVEEFNEAQLTQIVSLIENYLIKKRTLSIFKALQSANPIASPSDLWTQAEETYKVLEIQGVAKDY